MLFGGPVIQARTPPPADSLTVMSNSERDHPSGPAATTRLAPPTLSSPMVDTDKIDCEPRRSTNCPDRILLFCTSIGRPRLRGLTAARRAAMVRILGPPKIALTPLGAASGCLQMNCLWSGSAGHEPKLAEYSHLCGCGQTARGVGDYQIRVFGQLRGGAVTISRTGSRTTVHPHQSSSGRHDETTISLSIASFTTW
jgi:hypothetical protein